MKETRHAVHGMATMGAGQIANFVIGLLMALLLPRLFGATDYGHWIYFRSLIVFLAGVGMLGTAHVISRFYIGFRAEGRMLDAAHMFKSIVIFRCVWLIPLAAAGYALLLTSSGAFARHDAGLYLAASIFLQTMTHTLNLQLYGDRRLVWHAAISALQSGTVPLAVILAYQGAGLATVPLACMLGDLACMCVVTIVARPWRAWPPGWMPRARMRTALAFGGVAAFFSLAMTGVINVTPYLMDWRGYGIEAIGYVGFALRIMLMITLGMSAVSAGLFPSLSSLASSNAIAKALVWQHTCTRYGTTLLLWMTGLFLITGHAVMPLVLGASFAGASDMMGLVLLASVFMWDGGQHLRLSLLTDRTRAYGYAGAALLAGYLTFLCGAAPDQAGYGAARALLAGGLCCQIAAMWSVRQWGMEGLCPGGLLCCLALLAVAAWFRPWYVGFDAILGAALVWSALYFGAAIATKTVRLSELRMLFRAFRHPGLPPEPTEQPL